LETLTENGGMAGTPYVGYPEIGLVDDVDTFLEEAGSI